MNESQSFLCLEEFDEVVPIDSKDCVPFLMNVHYLRRMPNIMYAFGYIRNSKLIGVCTFGIPASNSLCEGVCGKEYRKDVLELNRLVILPSYSEKNLASSFVGKALRLLPRKKIIVSYADTMWGHIGKVYQSTNWHYTGATLERTDAFSGGKHSRTCVIDKDIRQSRSSKHRYVFFTGTPRDKKILRRSLKYPILEYPKGKSCRYDTEAPVPQKPMVVYKR